MQASRRTILALAWAALTPIGAAFAQSDTAAARRVFEANIRTIHQRDRAAYLALYLDAPTFTRNGPGPGGLQLGYAPFAGARDTTWPDSLIATNLRLVPVQPGVVYGTYNYRVTQRGQTTRGVSERLFVRTPRGWRIAISTAFPDPPGTPPAPVVLRGASLIDGTGAAARPDALLVIRGGRIACVGGRGECGTPPGEAPVRDTLDLAGRWIMPGLVDAHVHFGQTGWVDGRPDALDLRRRGHPYEEVIARNERDPVRYFRAYICSGVTAVFDVGGYSWSWGLRQRAETDLTAPHLAATGPLLSTVDHFLGLPDQRQILHVTGDSAARAAVRAHVARGTDAIKVWYIRPGNADSARVAALTTVLNAAGDEARRLGARLIVHATNLAGATEALRAGASLLVHSVEDAPVDEEFLALARERQVLYNPTLTVYDGYRQVNVRRFEPRYPTDCVDPATLALARSTDTIAGPSRTAEQLRQINDAGERRLALMRANLLAVHRAGIPVVMGTDAGNPLTLPGPSVYWEMEEMQRAGLTPMEVIVASTRNGARAMGRERDLGTLEPGKLADLIVLEADPAADIANVRRISHVMRGGAMSIPRLLAPR
jgi:imidazolonepropionase-like amidohydrolase